MLQVCFMLDCSASMHGPNLQAMLDAYDLVRHRLLARQPEIEYIGAIALSFNDTVTVLYEQTELKISPRLPALTAGGPTQLVPAFDFVAGWLQGHADPALLCLLIDGMPVDDWMSGCERLEAHRGRFTMVGINFRDDLNPGELCHVEYGITISEMQQIDDVLTRALNQLTGRT